MDYTLAGLGRQRSGTCDSPLALVRAPRVVGWLCIAGYLRVIFVGLTPLLHLSRQTRTFRDHVIVCLRCVIASNRRLIPSPTLWTHQAILRIQPQTHISSSVVSNRTGLGTGSLISIRRETTRDTCEHMGGSGRWCGCRIRGGRPVGECAGTRKPQCRSRQMYCTCQTLTLPTPGFLQRLLEFLALGSLWNGIRVLWISRLIIKILELLQRFRLLAKEGQAVICLEQVIPEPKAA